MPSVSTSFDAYGKAFLHAFKFPAQAVSGLLLGKRIQEDREVFVADVVPLFHALPIACPNAMLDVALAQAVAVAKTKGLQVVGLYSANELAHDTALSSGAQKAALYMMDKYSMPSLVAWQVLNSQVKSSDAAAPAVQQFVLSGSGGGRMTAVDVAFSRWNTGTCCVEEASSEEALRKVREALEAFVHTKLVDFDMHLENPQLDYFNSKITL